MGGVRTEEVVKTGVVSWFGLLAWAAYSLKHSATDLVSVRSDFSQFPHFNIKVVHTGFKHNFSEQTSFNFVQCNK